MDGAEAEMFTKMAVIIVRRSHANIGKMVGVLEEMDAHFVMKVNTDIATCEKTMPTKEAAKHKKRCHSK